jgi:hypothetical protein
MAIDIDFAVETMMKTDRDPPPKKISNEHAPILHFDVDAVDWSN